MVRLHMGQAVLKSKSKNILGELEKLADDCSGQMHCMDAPLLTPDLHIEVLIPRI